MASNVKLNHRNMAALLRSAPVEAELKRRADRIAAAAGPGMEASSGQGRTRARASVVTVTNQARAAEARTRALTRALDAGRG
jgi:hypothetical protein